METLSYQSVFFLTPILMLFVCSLFPIMVKAFRGNREFPRFAFLMGLLGLVGSMGLTFAMSFNFFEASEKTQIFLFSDMIVFDGIGLWSIVLVLGAAIFGLLFSFEHFATRGKRFSEFVFLYLNSVIGIILVILSNDFMMTFIAIEFMSLALYLLIACSPDKVFAKESSFKYFVLGSFASAFFLMGISFVFGASGSTTVNVFAEQFFTLLESSRIFLVGFILIIVGLFFKIAVFPFHSWVPDVYQGAPTPVTSLMSTAVKVGSFIALIRIFLPISLQGSSQESFLNILFFITVFSVLVGNLLALKQDSLKRMLAYSSVAHSGYMLMGLLCLLKVNGNLSGTTSLLFYLFSYTLMTVGTFALVSLLESKGNGMVQIADLKGLSKKEPLVAFSFLILLLSLAGIPPTIGFFAKFYLFSAGIQNGLYWLAFWGVIGSVISVYYYLKPIVYMYMSESEVKNELSSLFDLKVLTRSTLVFAAFLIISLGFASGFILELVSKTIGKI